MAEALLDMSLDAIIEQNKKSGSGGGGSTFRGRGRGRGRGVRGSQGRVSGDSSAQGQGPGPGPGPGPARRFPNRVESRATPYFTPQMGIHKMQEFLIGGGSDTEAGTKLYISNLDYGVTNEDIQVLFSEVGSLKRYSVHYDRSGRSKGTAEVVFARESDAFAAIKRYNNVQLDGKPMKIEMVGVKLVTPAAIPMPPTSNGVIGNTSGTFRRPKRVAGRGWDRGGGGGRGPQQGRGRGRGRGQKVSCEDLDADLEKYHQEAMQLN